MFSQPQTTFIYSRVLLSMLEYFEYNQAICCHVVLHYAFREVGPESQAQRDRRAHRARDLGGPDAVDD